MIDDFSAPKGQMKPATRKQTPSQTTSAASAEPFETPEQVSARDTAVAAPLLASAKTEQVSTEAPRGSGNHWFNLPWPPTRHEILISSVILFIAGFSTVGYVLLNKQQPQKNASPVVATTNKAAPAKPTTVPATLSGLPVAADVNQRPVVGVMIENSQSARPQSGLSEAGVIFEAIAEGGITRFLALYQDQQPSNIGPVRSARPYYVQWSEGFRAAYAHVGGSADALANIKTWNVQDINQFANPGPFRRVSSRPAPHNMYSNVADLAALATQKGFKSEYTGFERKAVSPSKTPNATSIDFAISSALYNSVFTYDAGSNSYLRAEGGAPQTDANNSKQLAPNVVVGMVVPLSAGGKTSQGGAYSNYNPLGSGQAYVFQDGTVTVGTWHKANNTSQISFKDQSGATIKLNPGQTWITALSSSSKVTYR